MQQDEKSNFHQPEMEKAEKRGTITLLVDERERNGAIPFLEAEIAENNRRYAHVSGTILYAVQTVPVGDYLFIYNQPRRSAPDQVTPVGGGQFIELVVERKTWKDLAASIKDDRLRSQHARMRGLARKTGCGIIYLLEGKQRYKDDEAVGGIPFANLHAKIRHKALRGTTTLSCADTAQGAHILVQLARDLLNMRLKEPNLVELDALYQEELALLEARFRRLRAEAATQVVSGDETQIVVPSVVLEREARSDYDIVLSMWRALTGVSEKTAPVMQERYRLASFICASRERYAELLKEVAAIQYESGMCIGPKRAKTIMQIAYGGKDTSLVEAAKVQARKLLAAVPGVSAELADIILRQYTIRQLCSEVQVERLRELRRANGNRINRLADRIVELLHWRQERTIDVEAAVAAHHAAMAARNTDTVDK